MSTRTIQLSTIALALSLLASCGPDGEDSPDGYWLDDFQCERLERETFEDCTYEEGMSLNGRFLNHEDFRAQLEPFCASPCNKSDGIVVSTGGSSITDVAPMRGITEITGGFEATGGGLKSLEGMEDLERVGKNLRIASASNLRDLHELGELREVRLALSIQGPSKLKTLEGLENVKTANHVVIEDHAELQSIEALESLERVRYLVIVNNPNLPACQADKLAERIEVDPENVAIHGNGTGSCE
ncbi:MAG: hypothetical protein ACQEVA_16060 [Myxococcota bacterium]